MPFQCGSQEPGADGLRPRQRSMVQANIGIFTVKINTIGGLTVRLTKAQLVAKVDEPVEHRLAGAFANQVNSTYH